MNNIIFIGTNVFAANILEKLIIKNIKISAIFTKKAARFGRGQKLTSYPVELIAKKYSKIIHPTENINLENKIIKNYNPNLIIIIDFGAILNEKIIDIPKFGCINLHPSILPKLRGSSPIQYAIIKGYKKTGVSVIQVNNKIDSGDILKIKKCRILKNDNYLTLSKKLIHLGFTAITETINDIKYNKINIIKQNEKYSSYAPKIEKDMLVCNRLF